MLNIDLQCCNDTFCGKTRRTGGAACRRQDGSFVKEQIKQRKWKTSTDDNSACFWLTSRCPKLPCKYFHVFRDQPAASVPLPAPPPDTAVQTLRSRRHTRRSSVWSVWTAAADPGRSYPRWTKQTQKSREDVSYYWTSLVIRIQEICGQMTQINNDFQQKLLYTHFNLWTWKQQHKWFSVFGWRHRHLDMQCPSLQLTRMIYFVPVPDVCFLRYYYAALHSSKGKNRSLSSGCGLPGQWRTRDTNAVTDGDEKQNPSWALVSQQGTDTTHLVLFSDWRTCKMNSLPPSQLLNSTDGANLSFAKL